MNKPSFRDYIENNYYDEIFDSLKWYIDKNVKKLDISTYRIDYPTKVRLENINIQQINVKDADGNAIQFDVIVEAEIIIFKQKGSGLIDDETDAWFRITCMADLDDGLHKFQVTGVTAYNREKESLFGKLSDALVPYIEKEMLDEAASEFLRAIFPEALTKPIAIPVLDIVRKMGLKIQEAHLSKYCTIFGQMVFGDCNVEYYCPGEKSYKQMQVKKGTILIDPEVRFMRNVGCQNNTIVHECYHWFKHKKYHELEKLYNPYANLTKCRVSETDRAKKSWTSDDWMEWQANAITPRILMPKATTLKKIKELIIDVKKEFGETDYITILQEVVFKLAEFFNVSITAAKIRMIDLGFTEAEGVYTYIDNRYIGAYGFNVESKNETQTYSISLSDSFFEYYLNEEFREVINSGNFTYIDGHFVICHEKYVYETDSGSLELTDYAKRHIDECCLLFDLRIDESSKNDIVVYLDSISFRKATSNYNRVPEFNCNDHNMELFNRTAELAKFYKELTIEVKNSLAASKTFSQTVWDIISQRGMKKADFVQKTLLSEKYYARLRKNEIVNPEFEYVLAICIGLKLGLTLSEEILRKAGFALNNTPEHSTYRMLLASHKNLYECNEILAALGFKKLIEK